MEFNGSKFQHMRFGYNEAIKENTLYFTEDMSQVMEWFNTIKDLGVLKNKNANFNDHIEKNLVKENEMDSEKLPLSSNVVHETYVQNFCYTTPRLLLSTLDANWCIRHTKNEKVQYDFLRKIPELR